MGGTALTTGFTPFVTRCIGTENARALPLLHKPTLLLVGAEDRAVIGTAALLAKLTGT